MKLLEFERSGSNAFNYYFEKDLRAGEKIIVKMPLVSANKRGINDIGWASNGDVTLYGTLSRDANSDKAIWQEIIGNQEINKVTSAIKVINNGGACRIEIRAIFN